MIIRLSASSEFLGATDRIQAKPVLLQSNGSQHFIYLCGHVFVSIILVPVVSGYHSKKERKPDLEHVHLAAREFKFWDKAADYTIELLGWCTIRIRAGAGVARRKRRVSHRAVTMPAASRVYRVMASRHVTDFLLLPRHLPPPRPSDSVHFCLLERLDPAQSLHPSISADDSGPTCCSRPCPLRPISSGFHPFLAWFESAWAWDRGRNVLRGWLQERTGCVRREKGGLLRRLTAARRRPNQPCGYRSTIRHKATKGYTGLPGAIIIREHAAPGPGPNARGAGTSSTAAPSGRRGRVDAMREYRRRCRG
ncbi:hypothetical protein C8R47DRAFT_1074215 [Mycena vitilis]|nr:hypothetical protein C8R47DRAFT_1074215 [Mycena vitilis]